MRISKDRQHNGQKKKDKKTNNDLIYITHTTKDRVTRRPLNTVNSSYVLHIVGYFTFLLHTDVSSRQII